MTEEQSGPALPEKIGRYRIIRILGEGGMGTVYEAEQDNPRRTVALKVVKPGLISPSLLRRFEQESQVLARLQHAGIGQIYDAGTEETGNGLQPYFAMELIEGPTLVDYAREHRLATRDRLSLMAKVCDAVQHAHQKGVIHRDLKPDNILVDETGQPKILDFGVARCTDSDIQATLQTDMGQLLGTIPYMSPEQVGADPDELDTRSDVYALGVVFYELLTERLPYDIKKKMIHEAVRMIQEDEPQPLSSVSRIFRGDVETIVSKALEKDRGRRYQSASDLASDIHRYLRDEPIVARRPSALYQFKKFTKRHKVLVVSLLAVFLALGSGTIVSVTQAVRATKAEAVAQERRLEAEAVTTFLQEMIASASPYHAMGRDVTMREVLDEAAEQVEEGLFHDQPNVEAAVRGTLGKTYRGLGLLEEAELHLRAALELITNLHGEGHEATADSSMNLAWLLYTFGQYDEAGQIAEASMAVFQGIDGNENTGVTGCMGLLSKIRYNGGDFAGAAELQRRVLAMARKLHGNEHTEVAGALNNLAFTLNELAEYEEAESCSRESLDIMRTLHGYDHPEVVGVMNTLALILQYKGDLISADVMMREALEISRKIFEPNHLATADTLWRLGALQIKAGDLDEAEPLLREALDIRRKVYGDEHRDVATAMVSLAEVLMKRSDFEGAEALYRDSLAIRKKLFGEVHPATAASLGDLATLKRKEKKPKEAETFYREAMAMWKETLGEDHRQVCLCMNMIALVLQDQGDLDGAEAAFREYLETVRRLRSDDHKDLAQAINNLASLLCRKNRLEQAEEMFREALAMRREVLSYGHPALRESLGNLAYVKDKQREYASAEAFHREFLEMAKASLPEGHGQTLGVFERLGENLLKQKKWGEAEALFEECLPVMEARLGPKSNQVAKAKRGLAKAQARSGSHDQLGHPGTTLDK